jgi:threonine/homoserine/homoserine lactone efflux protein
MTLDQILAFLLFSVVAAGTPGPSNALLTATGANVGVRRGLAALVGVAAGMGTMMFMVAFGLGAVILGNPLVLTGVRWYGATFLCWLAWRIATASHGEAVDEGRAIGFVGAAVFQWVNPKSWLVCASAAATYLDQSSGSALTQSVALGLTFALASLPSCFPWLAAGAVLQRTLRLRRSRRVFNGVMGALLIASVVLVLH